MDTNHCMGLPVISSIQYHIWVGTWISVHVLSPQGPQCADACGSWICIDVILGASIIIDVSRSVRWPNFLMFFKQGPYMVCVWGQLRVQTRGYIWIMHWGCRPSIQCHETRHGTSLSCVLHHWTWDHHMSPCGTYECSSSIWIIVWGYRSRIWIIGGIGHQLQFNGL